MTKDKLWEAYLERRKWERKLNRETNFFWAQKAVEGIGGLQYRSLRRAKWLGLTTESVRRCMHTFTAYGRTLRCTMILGHGALDSPAEAKWHGTGRTSWRESK